MVRLQRVTFLALHNYLGLTTELFNPVGGTQTPSGTPPANFPVYCTSDTLFMRNAYQTLMKVFIMGPSLCI